MIYVGGVLFSVHSSSSQGSNTLLALMEHPILVSASDSFKAIPEKKFSVSEESFSESSTQSKCVYIFQREYATVDPALVDLVGTDEATTCVGLVIRNRLSGMICVTHMDSPYVVDIGLTQMLSLVDQNSDTEFDVHLIGGFEDVSPKHATCSTSSENPEEPEGYSFPLCCKIVETLQKRQEKFHIQTLFVLGHNTRTDSEGVSFPIFSGFLVETSTGSVIPASFDRSSRCPDEIVRRIRLTAASENPNWDGKLLDTYDSHADQFKIAPCFWTVYQIRLAMTLIHMSDVEILLRCSTSPSVEGPDFVDNIRRQSNYLIQHPDWRETFPMNQPRVFERTADGGWRRC